MKLLYEVKDKVRLTYPVSVDFPAHTHDAAELVFTLAGSLTVIYGTSRIPMGPGDVFVGFPGCIHGYEHTRDFRGYVLIIPAKPYLSDYGELFARQAPVQPVVHPTGEAARVVDTLLSQVGPRRKTVPIPMLHGYSLVLFGTLLPLLELESIPEENNSLQAVLRYIGEHYTQPLSRQQVAQAVGYSESYISHLMKDHLNTTLTDYITMLRLNDARQLLRQTDLPVGQIAMKLGFSSIRSFNRFFAAAMELTPTAYRNQKKGL